MSLFGKSANKEYRLAKFYAHLVDANWTHPILAAIELFLTRLDARFDLFSINFNAERDFDLLALDAGLKSGGFQNFEHLSVRDSSDVHSITVRTEFRYLAVTGLYEFRFVLPPTTPEPEIFQLLADTMTKSSKVAYGYGRTLSEHIDPASENKIRGTFFGNVTTKIERAVDIWMEDPAKIKSGAIKGLYTVNLVKDSKLNEGLLKELVATQQLQPRGLANGLAIVEFSQQQLDSIRRARKDVARFVRA